MRAPDLLDGLAAAQAWIEPELYAFVRSQTPDSDLAARCVYAVSNMGLRERSFLVAHSARLAGRDPAAALPFALAAECFIAAALTSDDVLDQADLRWGQPSCLARWGSREAMLVAEQLHGLAHLALDGTLGDTQSPDRVRTAVREFREHFAEFFSWQFTDIRSEGRADASLQLVLDLAYRRTGRLLHACVVGPALAFGADPAVTDGLSVYGRGIGTLLQLRDDVLDFVGQRASLGKPILGDLINGQPSLVLHFALDNDEGARATLLPYFGRKRPLSTDEERDAVEAFHRSRALERAFSTMLAHADAAERALQSLPAGEARDWLRLFLGGLVDLPLDGPDI